MSTSIENLRRLSERDVKDHTALFDLYVTVGHDIDYLSIKFGIDPEELINLLEGYGEKLRITAADIEANPALAESIMENRDTIKGIEEFGMVLDYSGKGRYRKLSRLLIEEYIGKFYPGIASGTPENDRICLEVYLDRFHPGWRGQTGTDPAAEGEGNALMGGVRPGKTDRKKVRNTFRLY
ncbi:MAG: hypothetical protein Q4A40_04955 [Bacillota bacterium]|nr:hypothetical protein [Bacillota bacterium]